MVQPPDETGSQPLGTVAKTCVSCSPSRRSQQSRCKRGEERRRIEGEKGRRGEGVGVEGRRGRREERSEDRRRGAAPGLTLN